MIGDFEHYWLLKKMSVTEILSPFKALQSLPMQKTQLRPYQAHHSHSLHWGLNLEI